MAALHLCFACDDHAASWLGVAMRSILRCHEAKDLSFHIAHDSVSEENLARLDRIASVGSEVHYYQLSSTTYKGAPLYEGITRATYYRLEFPELLPESVERIVYLDADVVVRSDLRPLLTVDLRDATVGAVKDAYANGNAQVYSKIGFPTSAPYFNAGVLLIDRRAWIEKDIRGRIMRQIEAREPVVFNDQCHLNKALVGDWCHLGYAWNQQASMLEGYQWFTSEEQREAVCAVEDPRIVHYTGWNRPWLPYCIHPYRTDWVRLLRESEWAPRPSRLQDVLRPDRLKQSARRCLASLNFVLFRRRLRRVGC